MTSVDGNQRPAELGELCTCGRQAAVIYLGCRYGDFGHCGLDDGGLPVDGVCTFCGDTVDHAHYAHSERAAGRDAPSPSPGQPQGEPCPLYRLRLADPLPQLHDESVRPYDPAADRRERAEGRLRQELLETLMAAGAAYDGTYALLAEPGEPAETGDLDAVVFDIGWCVRQALGRDPHDVTSYDPQAGQDAVAVLVLMLRERLDEVGTKPNPLTRLDADALIERAGGPDAWSDTVAHDRPLLITRRVARRVLDPEVPSDIYRTWFT